MTNTHLRWVTWRWVDPLWWAERQLEATAFMTRLTEAVFDASLTSVCGITGRSIPAPAATVYAQAAEALAATMTAPAAAPAPGPGPAAAGPGAPMPPWEAAEPQRELVAVAAAPQLQAAVAGVALEAAQPAPPAAVPVAEQEAAERAPAQEPPVPGWDALTIGSIRARLRRLSEEDLVALHGYEERHAGRPDVLSMLQNRLTKVRSADLGS